MAGWRVLSVVGNPKPRSRTRQVAEAVAERVTRRLTAIGPSGTGPENGNDLVTTEVVEVSELGAGLLGWGDPGVKAATTAMAATDVLIVATPTYKATYTGLLKLLLDQVGAGELGGVPTIPIQVAAAPQHALAVEVHLRPVLVEIGASLPTAGLFVLDSALETLDDTLDRWATPNLDAVLALAAARAAHRQS
jgi:FMN reductase